MSKENILSKEQILELLDTLRKIEHHCDSSNCKNCNFIIPDEGCMFFNKPWEWNLGILEEKL